VPGEGVDGDFAERLVEAFHRTHEREYGRRFEDKDVELVNIRVVGVGAIPELRTAELPAGDREPEREALVAHREVVFDEGGRPRVISTPIYDRRRLKGGNVIRGPAVVEQADTTTLVLPDLVAETDRYGNLLIEPH
jgi:N-methylhydantoinase A/oxoprolinase/acetone carboxylase beta subunit